MTILITGASSGLGAEMARQFAAKGHDLALCARRTERLEELRSEIAELHAGVRVEIRELDVNDHAQVFEVFRGFQTDFGRIDRVIINAGLGKGRPIGMGFFEANKATAMTNFVAALAQAEAAMEIFREQKSGHLVMVSSVSAMRGMPRNLTTYAASKVGAAFLAEGIRADLAGKPDLKIDVTVLYPGFIVSEMTGATEGSTPLMVGTEKGVRSMVGAIEKRVSSARVPEWPWGPLGFVLKHAPLAVVRRAF